MPSNGTLDARNRGAALRRLAAGQVDVLVIGGGITGAGAALDAASRGLRVALVECRDLAAGTSSRSSKLIHGGLRYLEQRDFRLVWEALRERRKDAVGGGDARAPAVRAARRRPGRAACREGRLRRRAGRPGCPT